MGRDLFFHLIIMIGHGDFWTGTSSTEVSSLIKFLDNRSNGHRYFSPIEPQVFKLVVPEGTYLHGT
jgi:hypothetical protein